MTTRRRLLPVLALCLGVVSACSSTRLAYNNAEWLLAWSIDNYVTLNSDQSEQADLLISQTLAWHRSEALPRYASWLSSQRQLLAEPGLDISAYRRQVVLAEGAWERLITEVVARGAPLVAGFSDRQIEELVASIEAKNADFYQEHVAVADSERVEERITRLTDLVKRWLGSVNPAQKSLIQGWADKAPDVYPIWFRLRESRLAAFREISAARARTDFGERLRALLVAEDRYLEPWEIRRLAQSRGQAEQLLLALEASLSERQRRHLLAELDKIAEDISYLHTQG